MSENEPGSQQWPEGAGPIWPASDRPYNSGYANQNAPNPWSYQAQQAREANPYAAPGYGSSQFGGTHPMMQQPSAQPASDQPGGRRRGGKAAVAGVAVLALVAGGIGGIVGGSLASEDEGTPTSTSALEEPPPAEQTGDAPEGSVEAVAEQVTPAVVQLQVAGQEGSGEGSGFVISEDGHIMTNSHVVAPAEDGGEIRAHFQDGQETSATVVGHDPTTDIAVIRADNAAGLDQVQLGRSDDLTVGQEVVAIGSPFALSGTVTSGIISAMDRPVRAGGPDGDQETVMSAIQTDAAINPGNSGGPLVDMNGNVIAINSAIYSPPQGPAGGAQAGNVGIGFAIPIDQARRIADEIIETGQATQTYVGAVVSDAQDSGALIRDVESDTPAEEAGLDEGDVITRVEDSPIPDADALIAEIRTRAPGETVNFTIGNDQTVEVTLGGQPAESE